MEGHLTIRAGDFFNCGYSFKFKNSNHIATQFSVTATVKVPVTCPNGGGPGGTILIDLGTENFNVPAGNTNWLPTGDANSILPWQGSTVTPDLCGAGFTMDNAKGAVFTATVSQNPANGLARRLPVQVPRSRREGEAEHQLHERERPQPQQSRRLRRIVESDGHGPVA
jgi:hypothetical protein